MREDERELLAWNPMKDETIYKVFAEIIGDPESPRQKIVLRPLTMGGRP